MSSVPHAPAVLYLTFTGVLEGLGRAQVLAPLLQLAQRGYRYELLSFERSRDLANAASVAEVRDQLRQAKIDWTIVEYRGDGPTGHVANVRNGISAVLRRCRRGDIGLIHARGYLAASLANSSRRLFGVPYVFDARGYWIDERREGGRRWSGGGAYLLGKQVERRLYQEAAAVVTLTELAAEDVRRGMFGPSPSGRPVVAVTTCTDYERFQRHEGRTLAPLPTDWPADAVVLGLVGSINASYDLDASFALFRRIRFHESRARLLVVSQQVQQFQDLLRRAGVAELDVSVTAAPHFAMPDYLSRMHWGLLLLNRSFAKRASMPTKLAEFFAVGVRPVAHGCNEEVEAWVREAGSGLVLENLTPDALENAARAVVAKGTSSEGLRAARDRTRAHFSWRGGVAAYEEVLRRLGIFPVESGD